MVEFELPSEIAYAAIMDGIEPSEVAQRIFRDSLRLNSPFADPDAQFFVLSVDKYDGRLYVAGSYRTQEEAIEFSRSQTVEASSFADEAPFRYYPFSRKGILIPG
jgi:hypothetical protein